MTPTGGRASGIDPWIAKASPWFAIWIDDSGFLNASRSIERGGIRRIKLRIRGLIDCNLNFISFVVRRDVGAISFLHGDQSGITGSRTRTGWAGWIMVRRRVFGWRP